MMSVPQHIAIIMDGNGRWAEAHGKPRNYGHTKGAEITFDIVDACGKKGIKVLTLFAFGLENWRRPEDEVNGLMALFMTQLQLQTKRLHKNNIKLQFIGDTSLFPAVLQEKIAESEALTAKNDGFTLNIAASYSGQWDICQASKAIAEQVAAGKITAEAVTPEYIEQHLSTAGLPMVDLFIRTSGEMRLSNFMLWQLAYAEMYFTDTYWPDFSVAELNDAINWFATRERRFGHVPKQLQEEV